MTEEKKTNQNNGPWWQPALLMFARLSGWIAIPVILALSAGKYLDQRYDTRPWMLLSLTGLAFIVSILGIVREAISSMKDQNG